MKLKAIILIIFIILACTHRESRLDGFLYLRLNTNPTTLDPALVVDVMGGSIGAKLFNGLVRFREDLSIGPDIAESWSVSKDHKTYTFKLRKGVTFSNGREVTTKDFKYSFERVLDPKTRSPNTWVLNKIMGAREFMDRKSPTVKGIKVLDDFTLEITLKEPFAPFLGLLAMTAAYVVPQEEVERWGKDFGNHVVGTGPFILEEWRYGRSLRLKARQDYFYGSPKIKGIIYRIIPEDLTAVAEFEAGNLDVIGIPQAEFRHYTGSSKWEDKIVSYSGINTYYLGMNCERPPFNNHILRQAVTAAIDREKILETIYEGRGLLAKGPIPPLLIHPPSSPLTKGGIEGGYTLPRGDTGGYTLPRGDTGGYTLPRGDTGGYTLPRGDTGGYVYDPQKAKDLLKKAGYPEGLSIKIYLTADQEVLDIVEAIQHYLGKVGIDAKITQLEWSAYKEALNRGEPDAFWISWWADYPDPENFLFPLFHSSNWGAGGNRTRFKDALVDRIIEEAQKEMNPEKRYKLYEKVERRIIELAPWVFFWHRIDYALHQKWVKGYKIYPIYSMDKGMEVEVNRGR
jgi:peptide/nickel transport system substrate-binding protein/oligopeptide transport system substrate-binding protein